MNPLALLVPDSLVAQIERATLAYKPSNLFWALAVSNVRPPLSESGEMPKFNLFKPDVGVNLEQGENPCVLTAFEPRMILRAGWLLVRGPAALQRLLSMRSGGQVCLARHFIAAGTFE